MATPLKSGAPVNASDRLEREADVMGAKALVAEGLDDSDSGLAKMRDVHQGWSNILIHAE